MRCRGCGRDLGAIERVGRRDTCLGCGVDLHACRQCRFYDVRVYNECREPQAERVLDKTRSNFCDYFAIMDAVPPAATAPAGADTSPPGAAPRAGGARADLGRLFRKR
jgi:hypothetical protein